MELLNPNMLWSSLAIAVPIAIHFWHQRRAKTIRWAAFRFLSEIKLNQHRGLQFENLLLLLLRILAILLLSFYLAKPIYNNKVASESLPIHVFEPNQLVLNNFKFEAEQALEKKETVFLLGSGVKKINSIEDLIAKKTTLNYQKDINEISRLSPNQKINLYASNNRQTHKISDIYIPSEYTLHSINDTTSKQKKYIKTDQNKGLFVNNTLLNASLNSNSEEYFSVHEGNILVKINTEEAELDSAISYALATIKETYGFPFKVSQKEENFDLVFGKKTKMKNNGLWIKTGLDKSSLLNSNYNEAFIDVQENIFNGSLPEIILEKLLNNYDLENPSPLLSITSFNRSFSEKINYSNSNNQWFDKLFLLMALITIAFERWLSIKRNA